MEHCKIILGHQQLADGAKKRGESLFLGVNASKGGSSGVSSFQSGWEPLSARNDIGGQLEH